MSNKIVKNIAVEYFSKMCFFILSFLLFAGLYYTSQVDLCTPTPVSYKPESMKGKIMESVFIFLEFTLSFFINLICSNIKPYMLVFFAILVSIFFDYAGLVVFILYSILCPNRLKTEIYLTIIIIVVGFFIVYFRLK